MNNLRDNPWNLTPAQAAAFDAVCETGCTKLAARALGVEPKTIQVHLSAGSKKLGAPSGDRLKKFLLWDRFRRAQSAANAMYLNSPQAAAPVSAETVERAYS